MKELRLNEDFKISFFVVLNKDIANEWFDFLFWIRIISRFRLERIWSFTFFNGIDHTFFFQAD